MHIELWLCSCLDTLNLKASYADLTSQVLRYSALGAGIFYGLYRQANISAQAKLAQVEREYKHKQSLIEKAKLEYSKKNTPASAKTPGGGSTSPYVMYTCLGTVFPSFGCSG